MKRLCWILPLAILALESKTNAQEELQISTTPTFDMSLPPASAASAPGPLSMVVNPAGLAWEPYVDMLFVHQERLDQLSEGGRVLTGGASGLLLNLNGVGLGIQHIRPYNDADQYNYMKYTLALPLVIRRGWFSIGCGVELLDPTNNNEDASLDFVLGTLIRPWRYVSLGVVGRNLGRASIMGQQASRMVDFGLAIRPWWTAPERLTLAADLRLTEDDPDPSLRFTGQVSLFDGISLFGTADLDGNFGAGIAVDFQRVGTGGYIDFRNQNELEAANLLIMARVSRANRPGFILGRQRTAKFVLGHELVTHPQDARGILRTRPTLFGLIDMIARAAEDVRVDSILIKVEDPELEFTDVQELREALIQFKEAGKKVVFFIESVDNLKYYLASVGDAIYISPEGRFGFNLRGPSVQATFFRGTLDLLGIRPEFERVGKYKSYAERLANTEPSEPYREVLNSLANEIADQMFSAIAEGRKLTRDQVQALVDTGIMLPEEAHKAGLVDGVIYYDQIGEALTEVLGHRPSRMANYASQRWTSDRWGNLPIIAVVHARGGISTMGSPFGPGIDARQISELLSDLMADTRVDAVVLRVDSPGGTILGSDLVWREVVRLKKVKPVIVSMGPVAASGGYYFSSAANRIIANAATITGSIGVTVMFLDLSELMAKVGVSHTVVKRGEHADIDSLHRGRTPEEMALLEKIVKGHYQDFIRKVAEGRNMDEAEVDKLGQGRVWTGRQAKESGLVDELGGLHLAITRARESIGLSSGEPVRVMHLPRARFSLGRLFQELGIVDAQPDVLPQVLRNSLHQMAWLASMSKEPVVAMLPFLVWIK